MESNLFILNITREKKHPADLRGGMEKGHKAPGSAWISQNLCLQLWIKIMKYLPSKPFNVRKETRLFCFNAQELKDYKSIKAIYISHLIKRKMNLEVKAAIQFIEIAWILSCNCSHSLGTQAIPLMHAGHLIAPRASDFLFWFLKMKIH